MLDKKQFFKEIVPQQLVGQMQDNYLFIIPLLLHFFTSVVIIFLNLSLLVSVKSIYGVTKTKQTLWIDLQIQMVHFYYISLIEKKERNYNSFIWATYHNVNQNVLLRRCKFQSDNICTVVLVKMLHANKKSLHAYTMMIVSDK